MTRSHVQQFAARLGRPAPAHTAAALIFLAAVLLYLPSLHNGFAYDDHVVIRLNQKLHDLSRAHVIFASSYWGDEELGLYRPLASLSYAVDWAIAGDSPRWFHVVNVLWNGVACVLAFLLLRCLAPLPAAVMGALIFTAHPVHVEAVANVVGRAEVMAAAFSFGAMLLWLRSPQSRLEPKRLAGVGACYAFAMMSKESAIMLPALIALADAARHALRPDNVREWLMTHLRAMLVLAAIAVVFLAARTMVLGELGPQRVDPALDLAENAGDRIRTALQGWPHVVRLLLYPRVLLSDYGPRIIMPALTLTPLVLLGGAILGALVGGGVIAWLRGHGGLALVLLFLPVALLPVSNLIVPIGVIVAERALYLPSFALAVAAALGFAYVWHERRARLALSSAAVVVIVLFAARSLVRIPVWRSTETVFIALRRDRPDAFRGSWHAARLEANRNNVSAALQQYAYTLNVWPYRHNVVIEAASYAAQHGDILFAQRITDFALERWPDDVDALRLRAGVALDLGDTLAARTFVQRGLTRAPRDSVLLQMKAAAGEARQ